MSNSTYISLLKKATVLPNFGDFDINKAECNPYFFRMLCLTVCTNNTLPLSMWEPFAGHNGRSKAQDYAAIVGLSLISYDLAPSDKRVMKADSTVSFPGKSTVGGVFFHPPYFGTAPLSQDKRDISLIEKWEAYLSSLKKTVLLIRSALAEGGLVCAVGRDYRYGSKRISLPREYLKLFEEASFELCEVLKSEPDIALILKKVGGK